MQFELEIRHLVTGDEPRWRELWQGYCAFYGVDLGEETTTHTWRRIIDPASPVRAIGLCDATGRMQAMANYILHDNTWTTAPVCYLEDLFVDPAARQQGYARKMIDWLIGQMREQGWSRVYWMTKQENTIARRLYDSYAPADGFVRYVLKS